MNEEEKVDVAAPPVAELVTCALCNSEVPRESTYIVNARVGCAECVAKVRAELATQVPAGMNILVAGVCGLAGALVGAAAWSGVAIATDLEVGYVAVLVGFLAGLGVKLGAGKQRGPLLQYLAAGLSVVGLVAAKYMLFAHAVVVVGHERGIELSYFDTRFLSVFPEALGQMLGVFDVLFLVLALGAAYRVPKAHVVSIARV
jgi:hypothetical protein